MASTTPFGNLLRSHRTRAGYSQEALAERAGLSARGISDLERGLKSRPHPSTLRMLADALALDDDARAEFAAASRPQIVQLPSQPGSVLPIPPHPMLGREAELRVALAALAPGGPALLTLTGPGGVGKTRLGLELAHTIAATTPITLVELAPVPSGGDILPSLGAQLGLRDDGSTPLIEAVQAALRERPTLLMLDNCEHVLESVRSVAPCLLAIAGVRIVATSRSPLRLRGERLLPVEPLAIDASRMDRVPTLEEWAAVPAIALFVERTKEVRAGFVLTEGNVTAVAEICRKLDGLPLAIELAASRMRTLSVESLAALLSQRLRVLTSGPHDAPERHRTLRATVAWSHELLTAEQQGVFRRLAVFAGGCTLETAAAVTTAGDPFAALDGLESLVDQGLLRAVLDGVDGTRYAMLETVREHALEQLRDSGEEDEVRLAHARAMLDLAQRGRAGLTGPEMDVWLARFRHEQDNIRSALDWSITAAEHGGDAELPAHLIRPSAYWWHLQGRYVDAGLDGPDNLLSHRLEPRRNLMLHSIAITATNLQQVDRAVNLFRQAASIRRIRWGRRHTQQVLIGAGMLLAGAGQYDEAEILD